MRAKQRYVLVIVSCAFLILCYFSGYKVEGPMEMSVEPPCFMEEIEDNILSDYKSKYRERCTMESCFNFSKCQSGFKVFVYPTINDLPLTPTYQKILRSVYLSKYYTQNVSEACLFILSIDTLDRDVLSNDYVRDIESYILNLEHWNSGENHIVFNLYSGTWPDYYEDLGFDTGKAILAKASMAESTYRYDFDVSIPLVHKEHPEKGGDVTHSYSSHLPDMKTHLLGFKGKRYVYGIGSETRNALYHIHNKHDIIAVTTCKHGKSWKDMKDERCDADNKEYERYDYDVLIQNSSYCLVPRGRRLGSFRFVEVIQFGCIPVILSNGWKLPFFEVIDWTKAAITGDERLLFQAPDLVRSISPLQAFNMRQTSQLLWHIYFSSIDRIVHTTLEPSSKFTAIVLVKSTEFVNGISHLYKLVQNIGQSKYVTRILILWQSPMKQPYKRQWPKLGSHVKLEVVAIPNISSSYKLVFSLRIPTNAVFSFSENVTISTGEIDFAFNVWMAFSGRIVGFESASHYWDDFESKWYVTGKRLNQYSMVFLNAAIYHVYYVDLFQSWLKEDIKREATQVPGCEDVILNMIASHITRKAPIKVTQRRNLGDTPLFHRQEISSLSSCMNLLTRFFGYNPLLRSEVRMDPVLFKDSVSNLRKKYKDIELANP
ncbi:exostosin-1-like isoform X2 [Artemia franciscana]|uniref:exostosin-1-like isoform X2 n=1 Tax=Artemia franciscana TaxID=6661 RepID=UPI0032D9DC22